MTNAGYSIYTDGHLVSLNFTANITDVNTIKIPLTSQTNCVVVATSPDNLFNLKDGYFAGIGVGVKFINNDTIQTARLYAVRQNSLTSLGISMEVGGTAAYAVISSTYFNNQLSTAPLP